MTRVMTSPLENREAVWRGRDERSTATLRAEIKSAASLVGDIQSVPRVGPLDSTAFKAFSLGGVPFLIHGLVTQWPLAHLRPLDVVQRFSHCRVRARVADYVRDAFTSKRQFQEMSLLEYMNFIQQDADELPPYLGNQQIPELSALCDWPSYFAECKSPKIWMGPAGTVTPLHCDYDDNLFAQIWGSKKFTLYPPHHDKFLYTKKSNPRLFGSKFNPEVPDYETFPLSRFAKKVECIVRAGEILFLPAGWFHHVRSLEFSLSANRWTTDRPRALR